MSPATRSNSWASRTELDAGTVVHGFRVERLVGSGSLGALYEATQISLGRTVALRLLDGALFSDRGFSARFEQQQRLSASLHHPNIVPTYEAGEWAEGRFVAARYVRGRTLADLLRDRTVTGARLEALIGQVAAALDAAHDAGLVHGRITPWNVLVDAAGTAYLADLGLGRSGSAAADRDALAALTAEAQRGGRRRRVWWLALPVLAGVAAAVVLGGGGDAPPDEAAPRVVSGATALGSELAPGPVRSLGCGEKPGPNTGACTLSQSTLAGRTLTVRKAGVIRRWAVRGAEGDLALQVIARRGGHAFQRGFSQVERVPDAGPHAFDATVPVERGDRFGVLLAPGATVGARPASGAPSALRWEGALPFKPVPQGSSPVELELLLRADIESGGRSLPPQLSGRRARGADAGRALDAVVIDLTASRTVRVVVVRLRGGIALDAFRGRRRLARIDVPDARPSGGVLEFNANCGYPRRICLRWLNEGDETPVIHAYRLAPDGRAFRIIG